MWLHKLSKKINLINEKIKTKFKNLFVIKTKVFKDNRGWLKEEFKKKLVKRSLLFTVVSNSKKCFKRFAHAD